MQAPVYALEWTPAEALEDGIETRLLLWRSRGIDLTCRYLHKATPRIVLLGANDDVLGEPEGWLDGLDGLAVQDWLEAAMLEVPPKEIEAAIALFRG